MKPANLSGAVDHVKLPVPRYRKGKGWAVEPLALAIYPGERGPVTADFAGAINRAFEAHRKVEAARLPGDGLCILAAANGAIRRMRAPKPAKVLPAFPPPSKLHAHSKRCIVPMTERAAYPATGEVAIAGWSRCKLVAYPYHPLHEHRTKRGRTYLASHLRGPACPFDQEVKS